MSREQFEKLPEVAIIFEDLHPTIIWFCETANRYATSFLGFDNKVVWLNGAWYAFQEQDKKIDESNKMNQKMMNRVIELSAELEKLENRIRRME